MVVLVVAHGENLAGILVLWILLTLPLVALRHRGLVAWLTILLQRVGRSHRRLLPSVEWVCAFQESFEQLTLFSLLRAGVITILAYALFFTQCYLLALALRLSVGFVTVSYAVALGGLVTLLPVSISGLGTREATIIAYLGTTGVPAETAMSFSLLVFATFYVAGGLMGAVAWWIKPVAFSTLRDVSSTGD